MALSNREAHAVNVVLDYLLAAAPVHPDPASSTAAFEAAQLLADKAYKQLVAGIRPGDVAARWPTQNPNNASAREGESTR